MPDPHPLRYRDLLSRLSNFGVIEKRKGSGSRRMLFKENVEGLRRSYPIHPHNDNAEIHVPIINAVLRAFKISQDEFWNL